MNGQTAAFILDLPNEPVGSENASDAQTLARVTAIAVAHSIHQSFLEAQLQSACCFLAGHRFQQQLQKRTELKWRGG